jgi:hypothetical protein
MNTMTPLEYGRFKLLREIDVKVAEINELRKKLALIEEIEKDVKRIPDEIQNEPHN